MSGETSAEPVSIGVVVVSDRASRGEYEDRGGPAIEAYLAEVMESPYRTAVRVISDEQPLIEQTLHELAAARCCLILTTGGTGPAIRDVTPEATETVCRVMLPGFGEQMRAASLAKVATAILSRQTAGILDARSGTRSLVVNLPGQPKAIAECLDAVFGAIPHGVTLIGGPWIETNTSRFKAFRPKPSTSTGSTKA